MASSKSALKAIKTAIDSGDFEKAALQAREVVSQDGQNYNAFMFLGFAEEKLSHYGEAEKALRSALKLKPNEIQAYKGLITLYEKQGVNKLDAYHTAAFELASMYAQLEDVTQCQNVMDKYQTFAKKHGLRSQYRRALQLISPTSPLYAVLEGRVPYPAHTYQRILESSQAEENEWINNEIATRRTRLGAKLDRVTQEVKQEAMQNFNIEANYQNLIDWTQDDEVRHALDQELFQRMVENLRTMPANEKPAQRDRVLEKANGMVIIRQKFLDAWQIALEWVDSEDITAWDVSILSQYIEYFPDDGLAKVLKGLLEGPNSPFPPPLTTASSDETPTVKLSEADQLIIMNEGLEDCSGSMLAHRIMAQTYLSLEEQLSAVEMARTSLKLYEAAEKDFALQLQDSLDAVVLTLGRALITYQSPRHHPEARALFEDVLKRKPLLTAALLGVGLVLEEDEDYAEAVKFFTRASERDPDNIRILLERAWCQALAHDLAAGLTDLEGVLTLIEAQKTPNLQMKAETLYRIAYCRWHLDTSSKARKDKSGPYRYLIDALKANSNYAPAYTLLGIYFQDYTKNKQRSRVALQKAFELSSSELNAAERLAKTFADSAEWELVELVAKRVIDSGKAKPAPGSKKKAYSWPYAALGVVQMGRSNYTESVVSFQHALRISPNDYHSWVGLGESYHNAGRYVAASRAFNRAESIDHGLSAGESWFAKYMLANVQKELGDFEQAIQAYEAVLKIKNGEFGVLISLLQTTTDFAWTRIAQGHFGEAAMLANKALAVAKDVSAERTDAFNLWKSVGDACAVLGTSKEYASGVDLNMLKNLLLSRTTSETFDLLADVDKLSPGLLDQEAKSASEIADCCLIACILSHKRAISATTQDIHAQAVAWYNLGWAEHEAYLSGGALLSPNDKKSRQHLKAAIRCFKRAIELEARNSDFWNALGVVTIKLSPKVSQHSFIRSLHLNDYSARAWTNLGVLYLSTHELGLANEAFTKSQSADPEYAAAWIGQGILASLYGKANEARGLFTHAFGIADSSSIPAKRHYAVSAFDHLLNDVAWSEEITNILQPLFALRQLHVQRPSDIVTSHLLSLMAERVREFEPAVDSLQEVCSTAEVEYEQSEANEFLVRFAQGKADLARQQLGQGMFQEAIENAQFALDLSEDSLGPTYDEQRSTWRLSAHLTAGLAHSHLKNMQESIDMFQSALEDSKAGTDNKANPDIVCMLAQVLWAHGGDKEREAARSQLFKCVEEHEEHIGAVSLLAVITLLDGDEEALEVAEDDLRTLRTNGNLPVLEKLKVAKILAATLSTKMELSSASDTAKTDALSSIMLNPAQPQGWLELAEVSASQYVSEMALQNAVSQIPPAGDLAAGDLAKTYASTGNVDDLRHAVMLAPALETH